MKFQYEIKGITLDVNDLIRVHNYYEAACTAEYLMDNYGITDDSEAMQLGYDVRHEMDKYGYDEETAIDVVMRRECGRDYISSCTNGDYSPSNPWDAPGMSVRDFM